MQFDIPEDKIYEILQFWVEPGFHYLACEELGELQHVLLKIERTWFRPELAGNHEALELLEKEERDQLIAEVGDVLISLAGIIEMNKLPHEAIQARIDYKLNKEYK